MTADEHLLLQKKPGSGHVYIRAHKDCKLLRSSDDFPGTLNAASGLVCDFQLRQRAFDSVRINQK